MSPERWTARPGATSPVPRTPTPSKNAGDPDAVGPSLRGGRPTRDVRQHHLSDGRVVAEDVGFGGAGGRIEHLPALIKRDHRSRRRSRWPHLDHHLTVLPADSLTNEEPDSGRPAGGDGIAGRPPVPRPIPTSPIRTAPRARNRSSASARPSPTCPASTRAVASTPVSVSAWTRRVCW